MCDFLNNIVYNRIRFEHTMEYPGRLDRWDAMVVTYDNKTGFEKRTPIYHLGGKAWSEYTYDGATGHTLIGLEKRVQEFHEYHLKLQEKTAKLKREV